MTHSIQMKIKIEDYEDIKEIQKRIIESDDDGWLTMFGLKKVPKGSFYPDIHTSAGMPPFICFPKKNETEEDGTYSILIESGSHCAYYDTQESFILWVSWFCFLREIDSYGINFTYKIGIDGEEAKLNLKQALKEIVKSDTELMKYIKISQ